MIDSHCHINFIEKCGTSEELVREAKTAGVGTIINIGTDRKSSYESVALTEQYEGVFATAGVHPHDAKTVDDRLLAEIRELAHKKKVVAIGEIGLDYYRDLSPRNIQKKVFIRQLAMAIELKKPVVIHTRDSYEDTMAILKDFTGSLKGGVFHCFPGGVDDAYRVIELGLIISVNGIITFKNAKMAEVAREIPLEKMILETDAPYLTPVPFRGKTNRPAYVKYVYEKTAELKQMPVGEVEKIIDRTCNKLFGLVETFGD